MGYNRIMKKFLFLSLILLFGWFFVRFVIGGSEDAWICIDGQWVEHGKPSAPMPKKACNK